jgi:hypothetical protein
MDPRSLPVTEQIEYYAARHIWRMRDKETPSGEGKLWRDKDTGERSRTLPRILGDANDRHAREAL